MGSLTDALTSLQVDAVLSYLIAFCVPALDAVLPVLPSETVIIALGVATAGSTDPRIAVLILAAAAGAFAGDNLSYLIGRRFGPLAERRLFSTSRGHAARQWAEHSLERYGVPLIIACRFIPGGRTAVTVACGLTGYSRRKFAAGTGAAAVIWVLYAFWLGRLGGRAFEDLPWAGFALATGIALAVTVLVEAGRRLTRRRAAGRTPGSEGHAGQVQADHPGQDQSNGDQLQQGYRLAEPEHAEGGRTDRANASPHRVGGPDF
jgi:membrane protein DedA with SNARE-associated domain